MPDDTCTTKSFIHHYLKVYELDNDVKDMMELRCVQYTKHTRWTVEQETFPWRQNTGEQLRILQLVANTHFIYTQVDNNKP